METLEKIRQEIDEIDGQMARLFEQRMALAQEVALYKTQHGLPVFDSQREQEILARGGERIQDPQLRLPYKRFQEAVMGISKDRQHKLMDDLYVVTGEGGYPITIAPGCINRVGKLCNLARKVLVVTDSGVPSQYAKTVASQCKESHLAVLPQGEGSKSLPILEKLHRIMLHKGFTRGDLVVAVGGGVVGDVAGFAAGTYMRGIDFINIPTTLLAQVDSSVGGKTAVNLDGVKNPVGVFKQPSSVIIDPDVLSTLTERDYNAGLAEVIKMAATHSEELFSFMEREPIREQIAYIIKESVKIKQSVVEADEKENGLRRVLNFGHTVGHGIEAVSQGSLRHGECVAMGTLYMCAPGAKERLAGLYTKVGIPYRSAYAAADVLGAIRHDKKVRGDTISCVWVEEIGTFDIKDMTWEAFDKLVKEGNAL